MESTTEYEHDGHIHVLLDEITEAGGADVYEQHDARCAECEQRGHEFTGAYGQRYCLHCGLIEASEHHQHQ